MEKAVKFPDGSNVPAIGQGTWFLGEDKVRYEQEKEGILAGIKEGMVLIDTAEMYGDGKAEELVGEIISEVGRSKLWIVSKVYPHNAGRTKIFKSCIESLRRLRTDYLDLYLLHWRGGIPLEETVACMEQLKKEGKIKHWGVSNFDTEDMKELWKIPMGKNCAVNQVLYHVASRGIEYELLPWMREHNVPLMAYCPLAQGGKLKNGLYRNRVLMEIVKKHGVTVSQVLLAFAVRGGDTIAIPRSGNSAHVLENAEAAKLVLTNEDLMMIDQEFPAPKKKMYLDIV